MAKDKSKTPARSVKPSRAQDTGPAQPSWRKPPVRSRKQLRQMRSTAPAVKSTKPICSWSQISEGSAASLRSRPIAAGDARRPRAIARRVLMLVLAVSLTFGLIQLLHLPQLTVSATSTQIGGVQRITRQQIYEASGIEGRSIFLVQPDNIAAAVSQLDGIAKAQVHVRLPNQVLIDVQERVPFVAWQASQDGVITTIWLTSDGAVVPQTGQVPPLTLKDQTQELPEVGSAQASMLLKSLVALRDAQPDVTEATYSNNEGLSFRTTEGWYVWLGDGDRLADKLALLEVARQEIAKLDRQAQVIDLRYSNERAIWW